MTDESFYRKVDGDTQCKVCDRYSGDHSQDCIVPRSEEAMEIAISYMEALRARDDKLQVLMHRHRIKEIMPESPSES